MEAQAVREAQRALYEAGEYFALSAVLRPAALAAVEAAGVTAGARVLDVGAGDGNAALAAARLGADVVAVDLSPAQVRRGRARSDVEGLQVEWQVADAERLPFAHGAFLHVVSVFGAVFAPDPDAVAAELARVCRPGGVVALTAWPPDAFMAQLADALRRAVPDVAVPDLELQWGVERVARSRLAPFAEHVRAERRVLTWDPALRAAAGQADCAAAYLRQRLPTSSAAAAAEARAEVVSRFTGPDGRIRAEYLLVVARIR